MSNEVIPRKYFSGGIPLASTLKIDPSASSALVNDFSGQGYEVNVSVAPQGEGSSSPIKFLDNIMVRLYIRQLKSEDRIKRMHAAEALGSLKVKSAVKPLIGLLKDSDSVVRKNVIEALGNIGNPVAIEPLISIMPDEKMQFEYGSENRFNIVIEALKKLGVTVDDDRMVEGYLKTLSTTSWIGPRSQAREVVNKLVMEKKIDIGRVVAAYIEALTSSNDWVRRDAIFALGNLGNRTAIEPLTELYSLETQVNNKHDIHISRVKLGDERVLEPIYRDILLGRFTGGRELVDAIISLNGEGPDLLRSIVQRLKKDIPNSDYYPNKERVYSFLTPALKWRREGFDFRIKHQKEEFHDIHHEAEGTYWTSRAIPGSSSGAGDPLWEDTEPYWVEDNSAHTERVVDVPEKIEIVRGEKLDQSNSPISEYIPGTVDWHIRRLNDVNPDVRKKSIQTTDYEVRKLIQMKLNDKHYYLIKSHHIEEAIRLFEEGYGFKAEFEEEHVEYVVKEKSVSISGATISDQEVSDLDSSIPAGAEIISSSGGVSSDGTVGYGILYRYNQEVTVSAKIKIVRGEKLSSSPLNGEAQVGGIDLNEIAVDRQGGGVSIEFDPIGMQEMLNMNIAGFAPVIISITPLPSILPLLGLAPQREEEEEFEVSSLN